MGMAEELYDENERLRAVNEQLRADNARMRKVITDVGENLTQLSGVAGRIGKGAEAASYLRMAQALVDAVTSQPPPVPSPPPEPDGSG